jgi:hypothetical protein
MEELIRIEETVIQMIILFLEENWGLFESFCNTREEDAEGIFQELNNAHSD